MSFYSRICCFGVVCVWWIFDWQNRREQALLVVDIHFTFCTSVTVLVFFRAFVEICHCSQLSRGCFFVSGDARGGGLAIFVVSNTLKYISSKIKLTFVLSLFSVVHKVPLVSAWSFGCYLSLSTLSMYSQRVLLRCKCEMFKLKHGAAFGACVVD